MKSRWIIGGMALTLVSGWALAQNAPESLLPPGFDDPIPAPPPPRPRVERVSPRSPSSAPRPAVVSPVVGAPVVQPLQSVGAESFGIDPELLARLPTVEELEDMTPEEFEEVLNLKPKYDIPPAARRAMRQVGVIGVSEGGFAPQSLEGVSESLLRGVLKGNRGKIMSRWGHILMRRALASRLDAPKGMNPSEFAALRASLLLRMGEAEAARHLVQDIDAGNYTRPLIDAAFNAYIATADFTGICPVMISRGTMRDDPKWETASAMCGAFRGDSRYALSRMDKAISRKEQPKIDVLLAQKYAGASGRVRRAVTIEWDKVDSLTPWRYGLAIAVGLVPPENLMRGTGGRYTSTAALAPMLGLADRAEAADQAAGRGVLSSAAMVDLYGQLYSDGDIKGDWADRAEQLRDAYVLRDASARLVAMQSLWGSVDSVQKRYSRQVLTAYAAAHMPVDTGLLDNAGELITSMLTAGLDSNAQRWASVVEPGGLAWALLAVADPHRSNPVDHQALDTFFDDDDSVEMRKSGFLLAGLAGLGRIRGESKSRMSARLDLDFDYSSRWTQLISQAADQKNEALVALLAGLGMQGSDWSMMTPRYLFQIVSALKRVGLEAEARMIAAEAVARA